MDQRVNQRLDVSLSLFKLLADQQLQHTSLFNFGPNDAINGGKKTQLILIPKRIVSQQDIYFLVLTFVNLCVFLFFFVSVYVCVRVCKHIQYKVCTGAPPWDHFLKDINHTV